MDTSDISVVMCTYNGAAFVERQLRSILDQTLPPAEIVVGDDGSTDRTVEIVESVAAGTPVPIRVHRNPDRLGFAGNFLAAAGRATHRYVAFSDQDDVWAPGKLAAAREALRREDAVLAVHAVEMIDAHGTVLRDNRRAIGPSRVVPAQVSDPLGNFYGFTMMFERALLDRMPSDVRGLDPHTPDVELSHDRWVYFLATTFGRTAILNDVLAGYRQHDRQLYGGTKGRTRAERIATKLATGRDQAQYLAKFAAHLAGLLESFAPAEDGELWRAGADRWREFEAHFLRRSRLHDDMSGRRRLLALADAVRRGTYRRSARRGLGPKRFAEDALVAVLRIRDRWGAHPARRHDRL